MTIHRAFRDCDRRHPVLGDDYPQPQSDARLSEEAIFMSGPMGAEEQGILEKFERGDLLSSANA